MPYTLELLHMADQEGNPASVTRAPNASAILNALEAQDLGNDGVADNTIRLSSGDAFIPGVFYSASEAVFGSGGIADILIQNALGWQAITLGNHEFDNGTQVLADLISGDALIDDALLEGTAWEGFSFTGTDMPYLSVNLDFSTDAWLAPLAVAGGGTPMANTVTSSVVLEEGGELIGVVGATTPTLARISSTGDLEILPDWAGTSPTDAELDALAAIIQAEVDTLLADNPGLDKVIVQSHMQVIEIEFELAARLSNVDVIIAGGSDTILTDENDRLADGQSSQGQYPAFITDADGFTTAVVNTDGQYNYVGRLVIDFDDDGHIIQSSYDADVSGAYAMDDQGVADLGAEALVDPDVQAIADAIEDQIIASEGNVFGISNVFLNGERSGVDAAGDTDGVRTQETNLGNLTADANLAYAREFDDTVMVSIKNGGGIRASIGDIVVPAGGTDFVREANGAITDSEGAVVKPQGGISETDIAGTLAFNNDLSLVTLTRAELVAVLEHAVGAMPSVAGQFGQFSGIQFSYDPSLPSGARIVNAAITDDTGADLDVLVMDGEIQGDADASVRIVTLSFLAEGGDGYPFPTEGIDRLDLTDLDGDGTADADRSGTATFADTGTEQDAFAEYLAANFATEDTAYDLADTGYDGDTRIQNLDYTTDTVIDPLTFETITGTNGDDVLLGTGANEIIVASAGDDSVNGFLGHDIIDGNTGNDMLRGHDGNDTLRGGEGDDTVYGGRGNDMLSGNAGDDALQGRMGDDALLGGAGHDMLEGGVGADDISGGDGDDTVLGGMDSDTVTGGEGNDMLAGNKGDDVIYGGLGNDLLRAGFGQDMLWGGFGDDTVAGNQGDDTLMGGNGDDLLLGGLGNDVLIGGTGADELRGGLGADTASYANVAQAVVASLDDASMNAGAATGDSYVSIEILEGSGMDDMLTGNGFDNRLIGGAGNDSLMGLGGDDLLQGGAGADSLSGGAGDDIVQGGAGADMLTGDDGADRFVFTAGDGADTITDFELGIDTLALDGALWAGALDQASLDAAASVVDGDLVLSLASGQITLARLTDTAGLLDDIALL